MHACMRHISLQMSHNILNGDDIIHARTKYFWGGLKMNDGTQSTLSINQGPIELEFLL